MSCFWTDLVSSTQFCETVTDLIDTGVYNLTTTSGVITYNLGLFLGSPNPGDLAADEVSSSVDDTAYARQVVTFENDGGGNYYSNVDVVFPAVVYGSGAASYWVTHIGLIRPGIGDLKGSDNLNEELERTEGGTLTFPIGSLKLVLA